MGLFQGSKCLLVCALLAVRALLFSLSWVLLGKRYWFLPNIFSDDVNTLKELFRVLPTKDEEDPPKWTSRILAVFLAAGFVWILARHGPGEDQRKRMSGKVKNTLHEWLEWNPAAISGNVTEAANASSANVTGDVNLTEGVAEPNVEAEGGSVGIEDVLDMGGAREEQEQEERHEEGEVDVEHQRQEL